jgi:hypothetical protein
MLFRVLALSSILLSLACAPETGSFSCNNAANFSCVTVSITGGTLTNTTCLNGAVAVASCSTTDIIGRCSANGLLGGNTCPAGATCTNSFVVYAGGDTTAGQTACTQLGGTWSAR